MPTTRTRHLTRLLAVVCVLALIAAIVIIGCQPDIAHPPERIATAPAPTTTIVYTGPTSDPHRDLAAAIERAQWASAASQPPPTIARATKSVSKRGSAVHGSGACGGDLPPCWVMMRESGGDINAYNPTGCNGRGCYGKWQCDPRTCSGTGTEEEQDAEARALWDGGRGCSHWAACG